LNVKKIATWVVVGGMFAIFAFDIATLLWGNALVRRYLVHRDSLVGANAIHILDTGNSDCLLLESDGRFALIDSGWGSENPNPKGLRPGCEDRVLDYLKAHAADEHGAVTLDFILPTHYHYDHAGGFARILADPAIHVKTVYLRELRPVNQRGYELENWDIPLVRRRILEAARARSFPVEEALPATPFALGGMTLRFLNLDSYDDPALSGENDNSIVTLVTVGRSRALLMGDVMAHNGLEKKIAAQVGAPVDLLKLGHHGYSLSSSLPFLRALRPKLAVSTSGLGQVYPNVRWNLTFFGCALFSGAHENGLAVTFLPDGELKLTGNLHP